MDCEFPRENASDTDIVRILRQAKSIAVVGLSTDATKASHRVAQYLMDQGYRVYPVNPTCEEVLGQPCYPDLRSLPEVPDMVDIFRRPTAIPAIVDEAIEVGAKAVWMQLGLAHNDAADKARAAGLDVVMNKCTKIEHMRLPAGKADNS